MSKSFGSRAVLKSASFWAKEGRITTLLGRNGSGKTTLLRIAVGELRGQGGVVRFRTKAYERPRLSVLARGGLYYLEERARVPSTFRVRAQLEFVSRRYGRRSVDEAVGILGLESLVDSKFHELSEGEGRRVALAAAVVRRPKCLLADEPFLGLTPNNRALVADVLRRLAAEGAAIVTTGHEVVPLLELSDEVIWCAAGTTHGLGRPEEAKAHTQFVREYLGWHIP
ncbi:MAG: ABC transporter ATP-binding protein [Gemmatimonadota bacterium]|nr:MAG: ABC transporter ATP-binding protein [Gemmatimonadota bacterium]